MKEIVLSFILYILKFAMSLIYFFIKAFPMQKNKITLLSRQSDFINIDFQMLIKEFEGRRK